MTGAEFKARIKAAKGRVRLGDLIGFDVALNRRGGELVGLCPFHAERTPSFTVNEDKGLFYCFGCGAHGDQLSWLVEHHGMAFLAALEALEGGAAPAKKPPANGVRQSKKQESHAEHVAERRRYARRLWRGARPIGAGDPVDRYLRGRAITIHATLDLAATAGFHPAVWHPETGARHPALIVALRDARGVVRAVQTTFLEEADAGMAKLTIVKMKRESVAPPGPAAMRIGVPDYDQPAWQLGVAEGFETALSVTQLFGLPCWGSGPSGQFARMALPLGVAGVMLFGEATDSPEAVRLSDNGVRRHRADGRRIRVVTPPRHLAGAKKGADFNDVLQALARREAA